MEAATTHSGVEKARCYACSNAWCALVAGFVLLALFPGCSLARPVLSLAVRVFNYAQVPAPTLAAAERDANQILAAAGLQVVWLDCLRQSQALQSKAVCEAGWSPELPSVRLLSGQVTSQFRDLEFAFASVPILATVNYEHIVNRALRDNSSSELSLLLGCAIAHELGHLLLGSDSHSPLGIMQSHWGSQQIYQAQTGNLKFAPEQAVQLRERVRLLAGRQEGIFEKMTETAQIVTAQK